MVTNPIRILSMIIITLLMIMILIRVFSCIVFVTLIHIMELIKSNRIVCNLVCACNTGSVSYIIYVYIIYR